MVIKETAIKGYISTYLTNLMTQKRKYPTMQIVFIDLLAATGICRVNDDRSVFTFPGSTMLAAWQNGAESHFDTIYTFDKSPENRQMLDRHLSMLSKHFGTMKRDAIHYVIPEILNPLPLDANVIGSSIISDLKKHEMVNYLCFIDNEGLDITFSTIERLREIPYGDIIINYQDSGIKRLLGAARSNKVLEKTRALHWTRLNEYFGKDMTDVEDNADLKTIYKEQLLKNPGLSIKNVKEIRVRLESGFHYDLLFCVRKEDPAWFRMIDQYNQRLSAVTDNDIKKIWELVSGRSTSLESFLSKK